MNSYVVRRFCHYRAAYFIYVTEINININICSIKLK